MERIDIRSKDMKEKVDYYNKILELSRNGEILRGNTFSDRVELDIKDIHLLTDDSFAYFRAGWERAQKIIGR